MLRDASQFSVCDSVSHNSFLKAGRAGLAGWETPPPGPARPALL